MIHRLLLSNARIRTQMKMFKMRWTCTIMYADADVMMLAAANGLLGFSESEIVRLFINGIILRSRARAYVSYQQRHKHTHGTRIRRMNDAMSDATVTTFRSHLLIFLICPFF